jgi:CheY-like chemotaxis protein
MMSRKRRILVVEDDAVLRKLVRRQAEKRHINVLEALTGQAGFDEAIAEAPGVIVTDLRLPDISGVALLVRLKTDPRTTDIPVVVWSGSDATQWAETVLAAGAIAYVEKTDVRHLMESISTLLTAR